MTQLRKMMLEELQRQNYSQTTVQTYLKSVQRFAEHFHTPPDRLGLEHIRSYQAYLFREKKLAATTVSLCTAALRFFFVKTLKRPYLGEELPYPKIPRRLPTVLTVEEAARLINSASKSVPSRHSDDARLYRYAPRRVVQSEGKRHRQCADGRSRSQRQRRPRPEYSAGPEAAGDVARILAVDASEDVLVPWRREELQGR